MFNTSYGIFFVLRVLSLTLFTPLTLYCPPGQYNVSGEFLYFLIQLLVLIFSGRMVAGVF